MQDKVTIQADLAATAEQWFSLRDREIKLYDYQKKFLWDVNYYRIVNKSRQTGFSTVIAMEAIMYASTKADETILIVSKDDRGAKIIIDYCSRLLQSMPDMLKDIIIVSSESKSEIIFPNGSKIVSIPNSPAGIRGYSATRIYLDEFAHMNESEEGRDKQILSAAGPAISRGGYLTIISTPYGFYNEYSRIWHAASQLNFSTHKVHWTECKELVITGRDRLMQTLGEPREINFQQEYQNKFMVSTSNFIPEEFYSRNVIEGTSWA